MKYKVKVRQTIVRDYELEISDDEASNVVEAMDIAEVIVNRTPVLNGRRLTETTKPWATVSVTTEE